MMEGQTFSHYHIVERLGGGGMGVVYRAFDTKLDRSVALKFLPPELTRDDEARRRLIQEAKAASALDHANICTVHDIDSTPEGQLFIVMNFYEGETLKKRIARGPLPIPEALDLAIQIAHGLSKAHEAGIVHRDIKPANVMITTDGVAKIVDFGIAKVADQTGLTQTGLTLGTVAYMAPEQINGRPADQRSDIWSLGAVLYEMLVGEPPFTGDNAVVVMNAILNIDPAPVSEVRPEVAGDLSTTVARALQKDPDARYKLAAELGRDLTECHARIVGPAVSTTESLWQAFKRPQVAVAAALVTAAIVGAVGWSLNRNARTRQARDEVIPEIRRLVEEDKFTAAFARAEQIQADLPGDPALAELWPRLSQTVSVVTEPPGARVYSKDYRAPGDGWRDVGEAPIKNVRVPLGPRRWRFTKEGLGTVELATMGRADLNVSLKDPAVPGMVRVPGGDVRSWITGIDPIEQISVKDYLIDQYEVTNRAFKAFVDAGGYRAREFWDQPFVANGKIIPWEQGIVRFVDATGRPGPATWELGDYRTGQDEYPVTSVWIN
jgi:hypothetical protein